MKDIVRMNRFHLLLLLALSSQCSLSITTADDDFEPLFNGRNLSGWVGDTFGYEVKNGVLTCIEKAGQGANLFTEKEYDNFVLQFEFLLTAGSNNGIGIRAPLTGLSSKFGFEIQILDDTASRYANLKPKGYHGSIWGCVAAKRGYLKPVGQWNKQEIRADGNRITVTLNGVKIIDNVDVSQFNRPSKGHIGLLGAGSKVAFRSIKIKPLSGTTRSVPMANSAVVRHSAITPQPLAGDGWRLRVHERFNQRIAKENVDMVFLGDSITAGWEGPGKTVWEKFYGDRNAVNFGIGGDRTEHILWRLDNGNLNGITPKVVVLMIGTNNVGRNSSREIADGVTAIVSKIRKISPKTQVLVLAIFPRGISKGSGARQINRGTNALLAKLDDGKHVHFLDIGQKFLEEDGTLRRKIMPDLLHLSPEGYSIWANSIERKLSELLDDQKFPNRTLVSNVTNNDDFQRLFNGKDLSGWVGDTFGYEVKNGVLTCIEKAGQGANLFTEKEYDNFVLQFEFLLTAGSNNGIGIRAPLTGRSSEFGFEIQILDDTASRYANLKPQGYHGSIWGCVAAKRGHLKPVGQWNKQEIHADGNRITVILNGVKIIDNVDVSRFNRPSKGHIGLLGAGSNVAFRSIKIKPLSGTTTKTQSGLKRGLHVYDPVRGLKPSDRYEIKVRLVGSRTWQTPFAFITRCKKGMKKGTGIRTNQYNFHLSGWSHTYVNFEMDRPVEVAIRKTNGSAIRKAAAHSQHKYRSCTVRNGIAYLIMDEPGLITVDIDGQMDDQDTGYLYKGPPIHAVTIFGNPFLKNRPSIDDPNVYTVKPGEMPPTEGDWRTLIFLPGVHDIGMGFRIHANKSYYIPGDAIVYGTFHNEDGKDGDNIRLSGHGTISGARLAHYEFTVPRTRNHSLHNPIYAQDADHAVVDGLTMADPSHHAVFVSAKWVGKGATRIQWSKVISWRGNGDGMSGGHRGVMEDCFMRCNDDCTYVSGDAIRRVTFWNDVNGAPFCLEYMNSGGVHPIIVEDCEVIYSRALWANNAAGGVFLLRAAGKRASGRGVIFRNIRVSDLHPTKAPFLILMDNSNLMFPGLGKKKRGPGDLSGILFQNIHIASKSIHGRPDILWGMEDGAIRDITFDNVTIGGKKIRSLNHFKHNEHVRDINFK
jgi:lysophospholipase L1-like esterase